MIWCIGVQYLVALSNCFVMNFILNIISLFICIVRDSIICHNLKFFLLSATGFMH